MYKKDLELLFTIIIACVVTGIHMYVTSPLQTILTVVIGLILITVFELLKRLIVNTFGKDTHEPD